MNTVSYSTLIAIAAVLGLILLIRVFLKPIKKILKFLLHAALGFVLLILVNFLGSALGVGVSLEYSLVNCLVSGFIGIPGVIILLIWYYVL